MPGDGVIAAAARAPSKNPKTSAAQIFEWPIQLTRTAASTRIYGDRAERPRLQMLAQKCDGCVIIRQNFQINALFAMAS
jgi:hypothetical protein